MKQSDKLSRRQVNTAALAAGCGALLGQSELPAAQEAANLEPLNRFPRQMQDYLVRKVRSAHRRSVKAKEALQTAEQAQQYVAQVRRKIARCFGPQPERTPLKPRVTGTLDRDSYRVENVIFESRPNFLVTANLYLPKGTAKVPGIVGTCGHSTNGKAAEAYQSFAQGLARLGYACLLYDPIGQGERLQYVNDDLKSRVGIGVREHLHGGNQQYLVGENLAMWRAWDGIRALDYLESRPEIDSKHLGVTGNSGGGTMTTWLCGVEPRWTMAAPACFVTTFLRNAENELPADTEQCPPSVLAMGLEHEDFIAAMAPKPVVILAKERDFFDVRGSETAFARLKRLYELLGHPENISLHIGPTEHGYSVENREAMYQWFNKTTAVSDADEEPQIRLEKDSDLWCAPDGQVARLNSATLPSFTRDKALALKEQRPQLDGEPLVRAVRKLLVLPEKLPSTAPNVRILRTVRGRNFPRGNFTSYAIETEPGAMAISYMLTAERHLSRPPRSGQRALLYVSHRSADVELRGESWLRAAIDAVEHPVFTCDVRGIGESLPNTCGENTFDSPYGCDYFYAAHAIMLDQPYLGRKVFDVLRCIQWLEKYGYNQIDLIGNGWGALIATFAATLSPNVATVDLRKRIKSYTDIATDEDYDLPLAYLPPGILQHFDLDDCDRLLASRQLTR